MDGLLLLVVLTHSVYKPNLFYLWWEKGNLWIHFTKQFLSLCSMPLWWILSCFEERWRIRVSAFMKRFSASMFCCGIYTFTHLVVGYFNILQVSSVFLFNNDYFILQFRFVFPPLRSNSLPHPPTHSGLFFFSVKSIIWIISSKKAPLKPRRHCSQVNAAQHKRRWGWEQQGVSSLMKQSTFKGEENKEAPFLLFF